MTNNYKPVGTNLLVKIVTKKRESKIQLLPGSNADASETDQEATVVAVGTHSAMGIKPGHIIQFKRGVEEMPCVEQTEEYSMVIMPEASVWYIKNYEEKNETTI